jgi:putative tryptophan/tyrosine transport system ATP-binding protein
MLRLNNIHATFNAGTPSEVRALQGLSLEVAPGDFVTVIGANGAGKSTLFNVIAGTLSPDRGSLILNGENINGWAEHQRSMKIGRVFQNPALGTCPGLTVLENLSLAALRGKRHGLRPGVKRGERKNFYNLVREINLGLEDRLDTDVAMLSGGQRQAITLLMATLTRPELLLLDEHTAALDPNAATQILDLTARLAAEHCASVLMITHSMQQACQIGNRVIMMNQGQILFEVNGPERDTLTVEALVNRFRALREQVGLTDRLLLD